MPGVFFLLRLTRDARQEPIFQRCRWTGAAAGLREFVGNPTKRFDVSPEAW
jgi:hypothetical protein